MFKDLKPERYRKTYREKHKDRVIAQQKAWHTKNRLRKRGLTLVDYNTMLQAQQDRCKVCGGTNPAGRSLTAYPRGLVCVACAVTLGRLAKLGPDATANAIDMLWGADDA